jgi:protein-disulfide isomerase
MHDALFENQNALEDDQLVATARRLGLDAERIAAALEAGTYAQRVREDFRSGVRSGVNGTPTFFINGRRYDGPWADERTFISALENAAKAARVKA